MAGRSWGRLYAGTRNNRKLVGLRRAIPRYWWVFYPLLELAIEVWDDGKIYLTPDNPYTVGGLAEELKIPFKHLIRILDALASFGILEYSLPDHKVEKKTQIGVQLTRFSSRQYDSDVSTERTRRFKENQRLKAQEERSPNGGGNGPEVQSTEVQSTPSVLSKDKTSPPGERPPKPPGDKKTSRTKKADRILPEYSHEFQKFWEVYPNKKGGKEETYAVWNRRLKAGTLPPINYLMECLFLLIKDSEWMSESGRFVPHARTFLNQGRWTDVEGIKGYKGGRSFIKALKDPDPNCPICKDHPGLMPTQAPGRTGMTPCKCVRRDEP